MYTVNVQNSCSCFVKSGIFQSQEFETSEEAKKKAQAIMEKMRTTFCQKHDFSMIEQFGDYTIYIKPSR